MGKRGPMDKKNFSSGPMYDAWVQLNNHATEYEYYFSLIALELLNKITAYFLLVIRLLTQDQLFRQLQHRSSCRQVVGPHRTLCGPRHSWWSGEHFWCHQTLCGCRS